LNGVVPPDDLRSPNNDTQSEELDELELTQGARMSANSLISDCGTTPLPFGVVARAAPVVTLARLLAVANAFTRPVFEELQAPMDPFAGLMNCASAYAAATVVTSLMLMKVVAALALSVLQSVSTAAIRMAELLVPGVSPGFPPAAIMYTSGLDAGQVYVPVMLNDPFESVDVVVRTVEADPYPVVPTARS